MVEEWKDIPNYEGYYQVSNFGRVKSLCRVIHRNKVGSVTVPERILKQTDSFGYKYVSLNKKDAYKRCRVHRLVACAFIPNPYNLPQVNHKDEDTSNNRADNLEWCDQEYNQSYGTGRKRCGEKQRGKIVKESTREKLRQANLGKHHTLETRHKMSVSHLLRKQTKI